MTWMLTPWKMICFRLLGATLQITKIRRSLQILMLSPQCYSSLARPVFVLCRTTCHGVSIMYMIELLLG